MVIKVLFAKLYKSIYLILKFIELLRNGGNLYYELKNPRCHPKWMKTCMQTGICKFSGMTLRAQLKVGGQQRTTLNFIYQFFVIPRHL